MKRGKAPNARQKRWHDAVAQLPCASCGATPVHVHHCVGSTTRHNKVHIGQDWVIPLCYECHQGPGGVHGDMSRVREFYPSLNEEMSRKQFEIGAFRQTINGVFYGGLLPLDDHPPHDVQCMIYEYHK